MRILDVSTDNKLQNICVYLTPAEAKQMLGYLEDLIAGKIEHHAHLNDDSFDHEITLAIYTMDNLDEFDERSKRLILEEK
jgi:hypothetical protein